MFHADVKRMNLQGILSARKEDNSKGFLANNIILTILVSVTSYGDKKIKLINKLVLVTSTNWFTYKMYSGEPKSDPSKSGILQNLDFFKMRF